jgi:5-methylcytosine-specific restriction endonuclease McrBC regulatory subunit McrC
MNDLFERFVAGLLKLKFPEYSVGYHNAIGVMHIYRSKEDEIGDMIPDIKLIPDILIEDRQRRIIIDAKYKELFDITEVDEEKDIVLSEYYEREKVIIRGTDIYQLLAYMANDILQSSSGALVYPCSGVEFRKTYVSGFSDKEILILGIGLSDIKELTKKELSLFPV